MALARVILACCGLVAVLLMILIVCHYKSLAIVAVSLLSILGLLLDPLDAFLVESLLLPVHLLVLAFAKKLDRRHIVAHQVDVEAEQPGHQQPEEAR